MSSKPKVMFYDDVFKFVGDMGVYQICATTAIMCLFTQCLDAVTMIFVGADMPHWCKVDDLAGYSFDLQKYVAIPSTSGGRSDADSYSSCEMFAFNYSAFTEDDIRTWNRSLMTANGTELRRCDDWVYDQTTFVSTIVSRFDLVCGLEYLVPLITTIYMIGGQLGSVLSGMAADGIGRFKALISCMVVKSVGVALSAWSPNYPTMVVGRFILGFGSASVYSVGYVLVSETVGPRYRSVVGCMAQVLTSFGFVLQPLIAMSVRSDQKFQIAALGNNILLLIIVIVVNETPRWLIVKGRYDEAEVLLKHICDVNHAKIPEDFNIKDIQQDEIVSRNCSSLFKTPRIRFRTIIICLIWFSSSMCDFALSLNVGTLYGNIYKNTLIAASAEIPASILCIFLIDWKILGRRWTATLACLLSGTACLACIPLLLILGEHNAVTIVALSGKTFNVVAITAIIVFTMELFPTTVRNGALGIAMLFATFGGMAAPFIGDTMAKFWVPLPFLVLGGFSTVSGIAIFFLPETLGQPLFDTVDQVENHDRNCTSNEDVIEISAENGTVPTDVTSNGKIDVNYDIIPRPIVGDQNNNKSDDVESISAKYEQCQRDAIPDVISTTINHHSFSAIVDDELNSTNHHDNDFIDVRSFMDDSSTDIMNQSFKLKTNSCSNGYANKSFTDDQVTTKF